MRLELKKIAYGKLHEFHGLRLWEKPKALHNYAIGADVAEGVGGDASVAQVIDCTTGVHVACFWSRHIDPDNYAAELYKLGNFYNKAHICVEQNNHGNAILSHLSGAIGGLGYPNLYRRFVLDEYTQKRTKQLGFRTTAQTKPRLIENLKSALRDGSLQTYDNETILELVNFVRDLRGKLGAAGNAKDDRVMALALAWEQANYLIEINKLSKHTEEYVQEFDPTTGFPI